MKPNTHIGQHFLVDRTVLQKIVATYQQLASAGDTILEVGPGKGVLTEQLVLQAKRVIAVELDRRLEPKLKDLTHKHPHLEVVMGDIFKVNLNALGLTNGNFSVVANLPYQITGAFLRQMLTQQPYPRHMVLLVQKEVAERLVAQPGDLSILALSVQLFAKVRIISVVPPKAFTPPPAVNSALITITNIRGVETLHATSLLSPDQEQMFFRLIKIGFAQKRKMLLKNLKNAQFQIGKNQETAEDFALTLKNTMQKCGISATARAQELSLEQWLMLVDNLP